MPVTFFVTGDSIRERIVDDVVTALEGITLANGYGFEVVKVYREAFAAINFPAYPVFNVIEVDENDETRLLGGTIGATTGSKWHHTLTLAVGCLIEARDNASESVNEMLAAVQRAVMVEPTRGGLAIDTKLAGSQQFVEIDTEPVGLLQVKLDITYRHSYLNPYQL